MLISRKYVVKHRIAFMGSQLSLRQHLYPRFIDLEYRFFLDLASLVIFFFKYSFQFVSFILVGIFCCYKTHRVPVCEGQSRGRADYSKGECCGQRLIFLRNKKKLKRRRKSCGHISYCGVIRIRTLKPSECLGLCLSHKQTGLPLAAGAAPGCCCRMSIWS